MDYDEWERMKEYQEGRGVNQSLYDAVGGMVNRMYQDINSYVCDSCNGYFMSDKAQCKNYGSWNTRKI